jgi:tetratricopeptide (TPR) repeat protein
MATGIRTCSTWRIVMLAAALAAGCMPALAQRSGSTINRLSEQITADVEAGRNAQGLAAAIKLEGLVRRQQGTQTMNFAGVLHNQGMFLHNLGRYREAADRLNAALAIKLRHNEVASTLRTANILTASLMMVGRLSEAKTVSEHALALGSQALSPDDPNLVGPLSSLGALAREQEDYPDAERYFARALAIQRKSPDVAGIAAAMDDLGDLYGLQGRFDDGEQLLQQSLAMLERRYGRNAPHYEKILNDLGNLYKDAGRLPEAEVIFNRALAGVRGKLGDQHPNVGATMGNLALVLRAASRFSEAEELYKRTLVINEKVFGPDQPITAIALNNLANNYLDLGRAVEAMGLQQRVLGIHEKAFGPESSDVARSLVNLANSYKLLGRHDQAGPLYERALRILQRKFGVEAAQTTIALASLARFEQARGQLEPAQEKFDQVLRIDERLYGLDHPELIDDLRSLAFLDVARGNYPRARIRLERALTIADSKLGARHRKTLFTRINLASVAGHEGRWPEALEILRRATTDNAGPSARTAAIEQFRDLDTALVEALWQVGAGKPDDAASDEAFAAAQRSHETKAAEALAQMSTRFAAGNDAIAAVIRRQQDLKATLASLDKRITTELGAVEGRRNDALIGGMRIEYQRAQQSFDEVSARLRRDFPSYADLSKPAPLSISQTQALLKPDEALVSYLILDNQSYVFAVTRENSAWQIVPQGAAAISAAVGKLRAGLFNADASALAPFDLVASHELYRALLGRIEVLIVNKPKLLVVPAGSLTSLPFQVLVTRPPDPAVNPEDRFRSAAWLLNDKAITVLPSVASLRALRSFAKTSRATKPFIGFGDPVFRSGGDKKGVARTVQPYQDYYKGTQVDLEALREGLPALPETGDELRTVARALGAPDSEVRLGREVTVTSVRAASLDQYRVVDFATHGLVAGEVNGLSEPALVLSLPDKPTEDDDGLLTASRVAKLSLDADWAVLSACNTAAGDTPGAEGLSGLARAFFYAGARALLVSHWPVESDAAVKLTTGAFSELAKHPSIGRAEALRRSTRALIADRSLARNANPSVWAPFVLVGEGN